jgi:2-oxo-3-hexenedioate decarboxylase/2-keto-4-pentenoate hydratase
MTVPTRRRALAAALLSASRLRDDAVLDDLPATVRPADEDEAYAVQSVAHQLLAHAGWGVQVGWKIGCTTPVMQAYLGIANPCAGAIFQANVWRQQHWFPAASRGRLGVECEIAVRLGTELRPHGTPVQVDDAADAVVACMAAIEVVEDRYVDYRSLEAPTLIADDFFHHSCVLGEERADVGPRTLIEARAEMTINGESMGYGSGADILGEPLRALAWLANAAASWGTPLQAGAIVLLGSLVQTQWVQSGDSVLVENTALGPVSARF